MDGVINAPAQHRRIARAVPGESRNRAVTETVIQAITRNAAYELHEEQYIGSLEVGKFADLIVLDRDVATVPPERISGTKVLRTVVGGVVYDSGELKR